MKVGVEIPSRLAKIVGAKILKVEVEEGATVRDVLLAALKGEAYSRIIDGGYLAPGVLVLLNERDIRVLDGLDTRVRDGDVVTVLSVVHGG